MAHSINRIICCGDESHRHNNFICIMSFSGSFPSVHVLVITGEPETLIVNQKPWLCFLQQKKKKFLDTNVDLFLFGFVLS